MSGPAVNNLIQQLLERVNLVELISRDVKLRHNGRNWVGLCPFHSDSKPSFSVSTDKGLYYCFGCQEGGNALTYLKKTRGMAFLEAAEELARLCGMELPEGFGKAFPEWRQHKEKRELMLECNEAATLWYSQNLRAPKGEVARNYMKNRGLTKDGIIRFGLGWAPPEGGLRDHLGSKGMSISAALDCGLLLRKNPNGPVGERFRNRITFPVRDLTGRVAGFSARVIDPAGQPKYMNSSDSEVFQKGSLLYGLWEAREGIRKREHAIIVEGQLDLMAMHRAGFDNTVAPMGTALTNQQLRVLKRFCEEVVILFDGDGAGRKAALRAAGLLMQEGLRGKIAVPAEGADPDSMMASGGPETLQTLCAGAKPVLEWLIERLSLAHDGSIAGRSKAMREGLRWAALIRDDMEKNEFRMELARTLRLDPRGLPQERSAKGKTEGSGASRVHGPSLFGEKIQGDILALLVQHPHLLRRLPAIAPEQDGIFDATTVEILKVMNDFFEEQGAVDAGALLDLLPEGSRAIVARSTMDGVEVAAQEAEETLELRVKLLRKTKLSGLRDRLLQLLRDAEGRNDTEEVARLTAELDQIKNRLRSIES